MPEALEFFKAEHIDSASERRDCVKKLYCDFSKKNTSEQHTTTPNETKRLKAFQKKLQFMIADAANEENHEDLDEPVHFRPREAIKDKKGHLVEYDKLRVFNNTKLKCNVCNVICSKKANFFSCIPCNYDICINCRINLEDDQPRCHKLHYCIARWSRGLLDEHLTCDGCGK